jgi:ATP-dependent DNA ligase
LARSSAGIVFNEHTDEDGPTVFQRACKMGVEGIVSKRLNAPYRSGSDDWLKIKNPDSPAMVRAREERRMVVLGGGSLSSPSTRCPSSACDMKSAKSGRHSPNFVRTYS